MTIVADQNIDAVCVSSLSNGENFVFVEQGLNVFTDFVEPVIGYSAVHIVLSNVLLS